MLFPEQDAPVLKTWIVRRLETPSRTDNDVDADVLADYVLALLRHDGDASSVRKLCVTELYDFLKDEAGPFVDNVFQALSYKSYLPGARAPPLQPPPPLQPAPKLSSSQPAPGTAPSFVPGYAAPGPPGVAPPFGHGAGGRLPAPASDPNYSESRKRAYHESTLYAADSDAAEADAADANSFQPGPGERAMKQTRRGTRSGGLPAAYAATSGAFGAPPPDEIVRMQQQLGLSSPMYNGLKMPPPPANQPRFFRKKRRCHNLDRFGTCAKANCLFDHSDLPGLGTPALGPALDPAPAPVRADAAMGMFPFFPPMPPIFGPQPHLLPGASRAGRGTRSQLSAEGPVYDASKSTIVVEGIPDNYLDQGSVEQFFSQFGRIESTEIKPARKLAIVKFASWAEANAAYQSPKVIFDNRFVKVFWRRDEAANGHGNGAEPEIDMEEFQQKQEEAQRAYEEKLQKKQQLDKQREELGERMRELLAKQAKERQKLVTLMAMTAAKSKTRQGGGGGGGGGDGNGGSADSGTSTPTKQAAITQTDLIRAQLAALEDEARMLGLDPDALLGERGSAETSDGTGADNSSAGYAYTPPPTWPPRGGYTARGRGGLYRGRGRGSSYAGYAGYAGRGTTASVYAAYSLDNRPRRVAVVGVDFTVPDKDEALRQYLLEIGDFAAIETTEDAATITFADRRTAEQFYYGLPRAQPDADGGKTSSQTLAQNPPRMLPGISTPIQLRWVANTAEMATATTTANTGMSASGHNGGNSGRGPASGAGTGTGTGTGTDAFTINTMDDDDEDDNGSHGYPDREDGDDDNRRQQLRDQNMDFDVAGDDGGWDIA